MGRQEPVKDSIHKIRKRKKESSEGKTDVVSSKKAGLELVMTRAEGGDHLYLKTDERMLCRYKFDN